MSHSATRTPSTASSTPATTSVAQCTPSQTRLAATATTRTHARGGDRPPHGAAPDVERGDEREHAPARRRRVRVAARERRAATAHESVADRPWPARRAPSARTPTAAGRGPGSRWPRPAAGSGATPATAAIADTDSTTYVEPNHDIRRASVSRHGDRWSMTQSWIASSHGTRSSTTARARADERHGHRRQQPAGAGVDPPERHRRVGVQVGHRDSMSTTSPTTRSIVRSSRQPTRRFSPCSPIAGAIVTARRRRHGPAPARPRRRRCRRRRPTARPPQPARHAGRRGWRR